MKSLFRALLLSALFVAVSASDALAQRPSLDAARATKIATDYLATLGASAPFIESVTLEKSALVNGTLSWVIRWSDPIREGASNEIGVRVKMDGSMAHLVEDTEGRKKRATKRPMVR